jgi:hypothetical protein
LPRVVGVTRVYMSVRLLQMVTRMMTKTILLCAALGACTQTPSSADDINRAGTWKASFARLVDVDGPPYVVSQPAPEYPDRTITAPTIDASGCTPGCTCEWVAASDDCEGDVGETCRAWGGFTETCPDHLTGHPTVLDCTHLEFDSDTHTVGVCVLEDTSYSDDFGYRQLGRFQITLDRVSY